MAGTTPVQRRAVLAGMRDPLTGESTWQFEPRVPPGQNPAREAYNAMLAPSPKEQAIAAMMNPSRTMTGPDPTRTTILAEPPRDPNATLNAVMPDGENRLAYAERRANDRAVNRTIQPVPIDQEKLKAAIDRRQAERAKRAEMVSAMARGRQGMMTADQIYQHMLMRQPGAGAAMLAAQNNQADNMTRLMLGKMGIDAETAKSTNSQKFMGDQGSLDRSSRERIAAINSGNGDMSDYDQASLRLELSNLDKLGLPFSELQQRQQQIMQKYRKSPALPGGTPMTSAPISTSPVAGSPADDLMAGLSGDKTLDDALTRLRSAGSRITDPSVQRRAGEFIRSRFPKEAEAARTALGPNTNRNAFYARSSENRALQKERNDAAQLWIGDNIFGWSETPEQFEIRKALHAMLSPDGRSGVSSPGWAP